MFLFYSTLRFLENSTDTMRYILTIILLIITTAATTLLAQNNGRISGHIINQQNEALAFATVSVLNTDIATTANEDGFYELNSLPLNDISLNFQFIGYETEQQQVTLTSEQPTARVNVSMVANDMLLDKLVVTGTRTFKRQTESAVIVGVIDGKMLQNVQACNLSEGLKFQPGLRVETDCQTCNYTQLRMNGLGGGYSQILVNGRPIFSPLTGLYGMEQLPANMIERIEVVRGGGSALYGSNAIGGTVNIITKVPSTNSYDINYTYQNINAQTSDHLLNGNVSMVNEANNAGLSIFVSRRERSWYDHNGDNFSELPSLNNNSLGANLFFKPSDNQKLEISFSSLHEYRNGGEMLDVAPHLTQQAEERTHNVLLGNVDYQINFNNNNSSLISYVAAQRTKRRHFTGIAPDTPEELTSYLVNSPYGSSFNLTYQAGIQLNHRLQRFLGGSNVITIGSEYIADDVQDDIAAYNYNIDQVSKNLGTFVQSDWQLSPQFNLLSGLRMDKHNLVDKPIFSPRLSLLYRLKNTTQFRASWSTGFRAPQAFDTDLHIAFAGGGVSRVALSPQLQAERSSSFSASVNFDKATANWVAGFTIEGFYTQLDNAFYLHPLGEDEFGEVFEKRNGQGATVQGLMVETRANWRQLYQVEAGFTLQSSLYNTAVTYVDELPSMRNFLRTPNNYGYATLSATPFNNFSTSLNIVYTGPMDIVHFAGAPEQPTDSFKRSQAFTEIGVRLAYDFSLVKTNNNIQVFGGVKNLTNAYQSDFDTGKNRDSNYIYGPAMPRTYFMGVSLNNL